ncbi:hypothetical protein NPS70_04255 [Streptomyces sp. C10-9-1]|uniref:hypothetical protein n=1 Tax=Streptomyces sp. C10-9-1 TaxID=1859285 RepID=UPI002111F6A5|nr:hypothetical protein [Streptomyces sp. C10-9-1]MCQ6552415.1 hypothetical protein [Streptomyces sp. C10-9-1]
MNDGPEEASGGGAAAERNGHDAPTAGTVGTAGPGGGTAASGDEETPTAALPQAGATPPVPAADEPTAALPAAGADSAPAARPTDPESPAPESRAAGKPAAESEAAADPVAGGVRDLPGDGADRLLSAVFGTDRTGSRTPAEADRPAADGQTPAASSPDAGEDGPDGDEEALRRLLQGVVEGLQPSDGALDHLRRAVPARRARKRQALVGAAAAVLLVGTAVPAFVHVANSDSGADTKAVSTGHGEQAQGGTGNDPGATGGERDRLTLPGSGGQNPGYRSPATSIPGEAPDESAADGPSGEPETPGAQTGAPALCEGGRLGVVAVETNAPGAEGKVYGTFRIANVSDAACTVEGSGEFAVEALGAADPTRVGVTGHSDGDPAGGLPSSSADRKTLVLKPSGAYEVKFAWVPSDTCPTTEPSPDPSPSESGGAAGGSTAGTGTASGGDTGSGTSAEGVQPQLVAEDGPAEGSVAVTYVPVAGGPSAQATVPNACAGTVYRTGMLPDGE